MNCYIYKIINPKGKVYIGQTVNLSTRKAHYKGLHCSKQRKVYSSIKKYGWENHIFEVIETCKREDLNEREKYWIYELDTVLCGMNLTYGGDSYIRSKESNIKISKSKMGSKNAMYGKFGVLHHNFGKKASKQTKEKLRVSHLGKNTGKDNPNFLGYIEAYLNGEVVGTFQGISDASRELKIQRTNIGKVVRGERNHAGGYFFRRIMHHY